MRADLCSACGGACSVAERRRRIVVDWLAQFGRVRAAVLVLLLAVVIPVIVYRSWIDAQACTVGLLAVTARVPVLARPCGHVPERRHRPGASPP
jgi:hypothetical protein